MFVRWKRRQRSRRRRPTGEWVRSAYLVESRRVNGSPRQRTVSYLGTIHEGWERSYWHAVDFWAKADEALAAQPEANRRDVEAALATVVPRPTPEDRAAVIRQAEERIAAGFRGSPRLRAMLEEQG